MRIPPRPWPLPSARLVAADIEWTHGSGQEVRGLIVALLLHLTGRPEAARAYADHAGEPWTGAPAPRRKDGFRGVYADWKIDYGPTGHLLTMV
ncbi:hypothetical protein [Streptomyces ossamyceticus]|uniref:Uncharacterized protein n=1 Tax=Streptomyces ossamyceticus TaxID=249581 RepID=A0ABV2V5I8_9ACTN